MPCDFTMGLGKNSTRKGEPNSRMVFNTICFKEDRVAKSKVEEKYLGMVARFHGVDKVAKIKIYSHKEEA